MVKKMVQGSGFRDSRARGWSFGFRIQVSGFSDLGFQVWASGPPYWILPPGPYGRRIHGRTMVLARGSRGSFRARYPCARHKHTAGVGLPYASKTSESSCLQGCLAHETPPPRILQLGSAWGPMVIRGGWALLISEIPLYLVLTRRAGCAWWSYGCGRLF